MDTGTDIPIEVNPLRRFDLRPTVPNDIKPCKTKTAPVSRNARAPIYSAQLSIDAVYWSLPNSGSALPVHVPVAENMCRTHITQPLQRHIVSFISFAPNDTALTELIC